MSGRKILSLVICVLIAAVFFVLPTPDGLEDNAWHFLGLFIAVILAVIFAIMPLGAICLIAIAIVAITGITTPQSALRQTEIKTLTALVGKVDIDKMELKKQILDAKILALKNALGDLKIEINSQNEGENLLKELSALHLKNTTKTANSKLLDASEISVLNSIALNKFTQTEIDKQLKAAEWKLKAKTGINDALSGFSNALIWLIVISIIVAKGIIKTGLGERLAYYFISIFGKKTLGIAYSITLSETILAPVTPSNTARAGAIINPIVQAISKSFKSTPEDGTQNKIGTYLSLVNFQANPISSAMFITATAPNPLVVDLVAKATNLDISISWIQWALGMFVPGILAMMIMPLVIYFLSPPEIKSTPNARAFAKEKLAQLGAMRRDEKIMFGVFLFLLILWAGTFGFLFGITLNATTIAFLGLSIVLVTGVLSFDEILAQKAAWNTLVWFSALVMMATMLGKLEVTTFLASNLQQLALNLGLGEISIMLFLSVAFLYSHYFFASTTAHISAMFFVFYSAGLALGAPPLLYAFIMITAGNVMMGITHYATGTAPVIFGTNYVSLKKWWGIGFVMSVVNMIVMILAGLVWWKVLGFY